MNPNVTVPNPPGKLGPPPAGAPGSSTAVSPGFFFRPYRTTYGHSYRYGQSYRYPRYYVVAEKRGLEVTWKRYEWTNEVYARVVVLRTEKSVAETANAALAKEIAGLKAQLAEAKKALAAEQDDAKKKELEAKVAALEKLIGEKEAAVKPVVRWVVRGPMDPQHLDDFLTQLQREAFEARAKAGRVPGAPAPVMPPRTGY
jgi:hypothetical protein